MPEPSCLLRVARRWIHPRYRGWVPAAAPAWASKALTPNLCSDCRAAVQSLHPLPLPSGAELPAVRVQRLCAAQRDGWVAQHGPPAAASRLSAQLALPSLLALRVPQHCPSPAPDPPCRQHLVAPAARAAHAGVAAAWRAGALARGRARVLAEHRQHPPSAGAVSGVPHLHGQPPHLWYLALGRRESRASWAGRLRGTWTPCRARLRSWREQRQAMALRAIGHRACCVGLGWALLGPQSGPFCPRFVQVCGVLQCMIGCGYPSLVRGAMKASQPSQQGHPAACELT